MKVLKGARFTIYPDKAQAEYINRILGSQRWLWNHFLQCNILRYEFTGKFVFYNEMANQLPLLKEKFPWLKDVPSQALQQTLKDLDRAIQASFRSGFGFPRFKSRNRDNDSARFPQGFCITGDSIKLPKIGAVKFRTRNGIEYKAIRNITLSFDRLTKRYMVSVCFEDETACLPETGNAIGIDMGSVRLLTDSNGNFEQCLRDYPQIKKLLHRIQQEQQKLSGITELVKKGFPVTFHLIGRKRKTLALLHRKLANFARDVLHKISVKLVKENDLIAVENLKIKNMTKSAKGTLEEPGHNVKQKSGLNRNLLSNRISMFLGMLEYKCRWHGRQFVKVNPKNTSRKCSVCGYIDKNNRVDQSHFKCLSCGNEMNADHNAAINILNSGVAADSGFAAGV